MLLLRNTLRQRNALHRSNMPRLNGRLHRSNMLRLNGRPHRSNTQRLNGRLRHSNMLHRSNMLRLNGRPHRSNMPRRSNTPRHSNTLRRSNTQRQSNMLHRRKGPSQRACSAEARPARTEAHGQPWAFVHSSETALSHLFGCGERSAIAVSPLPLSMGHGQLVALLGRQFGGFKQGPLIAWKAA